MSIEGIFLVHGSCSHEGNIGAVLLIENERVFHVSLIPVGLDVYAIEFFALHGFFHVIVHLLKGLSSATMFADERDAGTQHVVFRLEYPSVLQVVLQNVGHILEAIHVHIVGSPSVLIVCKQLGSELAVEMYVGSGVGFQLSVGIAIEVGLHARLGICLEIFHVDLACDAFVSGFYR